MTVLTQPRYVLAGGHHNPCLPLTNPNHLIHARIVCTPTDAPAWIKRRYDFADHAQAFICETFKDVRLYKSSVRYRVERVEWEYLTDDLDAVLSVGNLPDGHTWRIDVPVDGEWVVASLGGPGYIAGLRRDIVWWVGLHGGFRLWRGRVDWSAIPGWETP